MKKPFVYLAIPFLLSLQACNNNSASKNTAADSIATDTTTAATGNISPVNEDTTASGKNIAHIDASEVPGSVVTAFKNKYPDVSNAKWVTGSNKLGKNFYRARWQTNGKKMVAMFKDDGSFVKEKQLQ